MVQKHASTRWSSSFVAIKARIITCLVATLIVTLFAPLAPAAAINPGDLDTTFGANGSINVKELFGRYVNVEKIKTDSDNRTVVLASFEDEYGFDNHILFRLNADGSYDNTFGESGPLNGNNYVLVALTSSLYIFERVDLEIDSLGRMLVMLSGSQGFGFDSQYQSFVARYLESGAIDSSFGEDGVVGGLEPQEGFPSLVTDLVLDTPAAGNGFLTIGMSFFTVGGGIPLTYLVIRRYNQQGDLVTDFGDEGEVEIDTEITFFSDVCLAEYCEVTPNDARIVPDNEGGYLIAYTGFYQSMGNSLPTTGLVRLNPNGLQDSDFAAGVPLPNEFLLAEFVENQILLPFFIFTDIVPDGQDSFLISGTAIRFPSSAISLLFRLNTAGDLDLDFDVSARINGLNYNLSSPDPGDNINTDGIDCFNLALFRNENPSETSTAIIVGDACDAGGFLVSAQSALLGFSQVGVLDQTFGEEGFVGLPNIDDEGEFSSIITQLEPTRDGKLLVLRGAEPTSGLIGFLGRAGLGSTDTSDGVVTISRYNLSQSVPAFTLTQANETATVGTAITSPIYSITPTVGSFNRYAISPSLPTGITFDTSTALIAGTPQVSTGLVTYTVTGFTDINETATATFGLRVLAAPSSCANGGVCQVGDTGPGGGIVFYVAPTTFTQPGATISMCSTWCKYLEAAPSTWFSPSGDPRRTWAGSDYQTQRVFFNGIYPVLGTDGLSIGAGYQNSEYLRATDGNTAANTAAVAARAYTGGGKSDWYLPSKDELNQLYINRVITGASDGYWSSSEINESTAWDQGFDNGVQGAGRKTTTTPVRPIRAFGTAPTTISIANVVIPAPVTGATPVSSIASNGQYTTAITWSGSPSIFDSSTAYTATVTVTPVAGYTLTGAATNLFTVNGNTPTSVVSPITSSVLGTTGLGPFAIAVDSIGNVYTTNQKTNTVTKITSLGVSTILGSTGGFPVGIAVDSIGNVYTANLAANSVTKITPDGTSSPFGITDSTTAAIAIDRVGNIYVANNVSNRVTKITPDGTSTILGATGRNPFSIAVDSIGNVYTANLDANTVTKITPDGTSTTLGTTGRNPFSIAVDSIGNVYTANAADDTVTKFTVTPQGVTSSTFVTSGGFPWGIAVDSIGNIYTANMAWGAARAKVTKITPQGVASNLLTYPDFVPLAVTVDSLGNVYTLDSFNRVIKLSPTNSGVFTYQFPATAAPVAAPVFTLSTASVSATTGSAITGYTISSTGGAITSYAISPAINNGTLTFNTSTGLLSGTPNTAASAVTYTITATNATGTATRTFSMTVSALAPVVVAVAPTPVPYLKTLTKPKLNLKDGKLICTPGTYNAGYTLDGVIQGSGTTLFTPSSFTYNLLINGITQTSLVVTSSNTSASWNIPASAAGALLTCSVTVSANGVTNTDKSSDNATSSSSALSTQTTAIATANATYTAAVSANEKAYQKALVDNRAKWRSDIEKIRTDYYAERDRIKSLPSTKTTRTQASAALKAYTAAQKKSAADYKASQPAAATARDAANKAALDAKTAAIAKANATYGTFIESIGYGVLIP